MHVHVQAPDGEAKFWIEPLVALAWQQGLTARELARIQSVVEEHVDEIVSAWKEHFGR